MSEPLQPLQPAAAPSSAAEFVAGLGLDAASPHADRPRVVAAMIGAADGRATVDGGASGLGSPADRDVLRELRTACDALLVGPGTLIAEQYATVLDPPQRERRLERGRCAEPLVATITRSGDARLAQVPLFAEPELRVQVYTEADPPPDLQRGAQVSVQQSPAGSLTPAVALAHLHRERGVRSLLCEGGPSLLHELVAAGLVDDLVLTIAPLLIAGDGRSIVNGDRFDPPARFALRSVLRAVDHLFLHYVPA